MRLHFHHQVDKQTWGSTWKVTQEIVCQKVSTTTGPMIPTWYRYTEDQAYVIALR